MHDALLGMSAPDTDRRIMETSECHGMPMQYVPDDWRCRVQGTVFALAGGLVA